MAAGGAMMGIGMLESGIGTLLQSKAVDRARDKYESSKEHYLPNIPLLGDQYFAELAGHYNESAALSDKANTASFNEAMRRREAALPGYSAGIAKTMPMIFDLMQGKVPKSWMDTFLSQGAAQGVGSGLGENFIDLNKALWGTRGQAQTQQLGFSFLPTLLGALPQAPMMSPTAWLDNIMNPAQRTQAQLQVRGQNMAVDRDLFGSPTGEMLIYQHMQQEGDRLAGMGSMGMMNGMGGGGAGGGTGGGSDLSWGKYKSTEFAFNGSGIPYQYGD